MMPLARVQWGGILLAVGGAILMSYVAAQSVGAPPAHLKWLLLAGIAGLLAGGASVQLTWKSQQVRVRA